MSKGVDCSVPSRVHRSHTAVVVVVVVVVIRVGSSMKDRLTVKPFQGSAQMVGVNVIGEAVGWEVSLGGTRSVEGS